MLFGTLIAQMSGQPLTDNQFRVVRVVGRLSVRSPITASHEIGPQSRVEAGDELTTGANSEADLQTASGAVIHMYPDSRLSLAGPPSPFSEFLHLLFGSIKVHVERLSGRPNPHSLTTPTAVIAVRGTTFSVFVDDADATLVAVDEGLIAVANRARPNDEEVIGAGQRTWVRGSLRPLRAQAFRGPSERADMMAGNRNGMAASMMNGATADSAMSSAMGANRTAMSGGAGMPSKGH